MHALNKGVCGFLLSVAASALPAQNFNFLSKGPVAYLNEADEALLRAAFDEALDAKADGEMIEWSNPDSGHSGTITMLDTHEDYGTTCRTLRTFTRAAGREGGGDYRLCRAEDATWQFAPLRRKQSS